MIYTENKVYGFKFFKLNVKLTPNDFDINIRTHEKITLETMKYISDKISSTFYISLKDSDLEKEIIDFKRMKLNDGANSKFEFEHTISLPFNNKGRNSQKKVDAYNQTIDELNELTSNFDINQLINEFILDLTNYVDRVNEEVNERMIKHFSKISSYEFDKSEKIITQQEKIAEMEKLLQIEKDKIKSLKIEEIKTDIQNKDGFSDKQKEDIINGLEDYTELVIPTF